MATIYKFKVKCVSAFCAYSEEEIKLIIENALRKWKSATGLKLESIEVEKIK
jgi:hypothetical protein